ncbi:MAG: hypothetical protein K8R92_08500 [Planctomycetes bacterium]|nr:hypothetical protein [Planctomycetota bacterium]
MPSRRSVATWTILIGVMAFLGAALLIGFVATLVIGLQTWSGPDTGQAHYNVEVVQTPKGIQLVREYRDALLVKDGVILARVAFDMIQSDHPRGMPIHRHWELRMGSISFQHDQVPGAGVSNEEIGFYRAAVAESMHTSNALSPFTPATIEQARTIDTFDETIWTNAAIYGWTSMTHSPLILGIFIAACSGIAWLVVHRANRGLRRAARGCCRRCGYDLAGIAPDFCPECGHATDLEDPKRHIVS